jgi:hypothetical protein
MVCKGLHERAPRPRFVPPAPSYAYPHID